MICLEIRGNLKLKMTGFGTQKEKKRKRPQQNPHREAGRKIRFSAATGITTSGILTPLEQVSLSFET